MRHDWVTKANVSIYDYTPMNWGLGGHEGDKHDEGNAFVVKTPVVEEGRLLHRSNHWNPLGKF